MIPEAFRDALSKHFPNDHHVKEELEQALSERHNQGKVFINHKLDETNVGFALLAVAAADVLAS